MTLEELLDDFYRISGKSVAIVDRHFHTILVERGSRCDSFCSYIHVSGVCLKRCLQSDREAFLYTQQSRTLYIYRCPFGLTEVMIPIFDGSDVCAYFFVVMGLDKKEHAALCAERVLTYCNNFSYDSLKEIAEALPHDSEALWECYYNMLLVLAEYIGTHRLLDRERQTLGELIKAQINQSLDQKITLSQLSKKLHRSTVTLTECFRKEFGISIMQYVFSQRMSRAKKLLEEGSLSIGEIALACGFPDIEYFSKCFKRTYGKAPGKYRKELPAPR